MTTRPGQRGYAQPGEPVLAAYPGEDGLWHVDEIVADGSRQDAGEFIRLDLAYFYGHLIALARARTVRQGLTLSPVQAITAADMVYIIAELVADETAVHVVDAVDDVRDAAHLLALRLLHERT